MCEPDSNYNSVVHPNSVTGVTGVTYGRGGNRPPTSPRSPHHASSLRPRGQHRTLVPDPSRRCRGRRRDRGRRAPAGPRRGRGLDVLGLGGHHVAHRPPDAGVQAARQQPGHARHLHGARLRPVPRAGAVQDGRLAQGLAVPGCRHLHLRRLARLPRPTEPHADVDPPSWPAAGGCCRSPSARRPTATRRSRATAPTR